MQDEHFLREWNAGHARFSAGIDQAVRGMAQLLPWRGNHSQGSDETPLARKAKLTGTAVIGGLTAGMGMAVILFTLAAIAGPELSHAASIVCTAPAPLA